MDAFSDGLADLPDAMRRRYTLMRSVRLVRPAWREIAGFLGAFAHANGLRVIETVNVERDGKCWHHVSASRAARIPDWHDMTLVRLDFVGEDRECYMVLPPAERYVNTHPYTLHLWCCLDAVAGVLPDFRHLGQV
jgi:hypothetical protein